MNTAIVRPRFFSVSAGCHINDVMNSPVLLTLERRVSAGCHINDVMNTLKSHITVYIVSAGCHINDVMNQDFHLSM